MTLLSLRIASKISHGRNNLITTATTTASDRKVLVFLSLKTLKILTDAPESGAVQMKRVKWNCSVAVRSYIKALSIL